MSNIEKVARAIYERDISDDSIPDELKWDDLAAWQKQEFFSMARVAVDAMQPEIPLRESVLQNDLQEFLTILGLPDTARAESPHQVFQNCLAVLKMRTNYKEPLNN